MKNSINLEITNCMDCPNHHVTGDPDPTDSFCNDDEAVLCKIKENDNEGRHWASGQLWPYKAITCSCRPYNKRKECNIPDWCPLI